MNRINKLFTQKKGNILNIYFTAGFPKLNDTTTIIEALQNSGANIIEIGMPYSDPVADGPTIQQSNQIALDNGMTIKLLFEQLSGIRQKGITIPIILMGYFNPILQYGVANFCQKCKEVGVDGLILPDLPIAEYDEEYKSIFQTNGIHNIFLITPQTTDERIRQIDSISDSFIYMVSSSSTTGAKTSVSSTQAAYFARISSMNLTNPTLIGFGISDQSTFQAACKNGQGAIIGSAFVNLIATSQNLPADINQFVKSIID
jgi:tryptophan synthase alpha chain